MLFAKFWFVWQLINNEFAFALFGKILQKKKLVFVENIQNNLNKKHFVV
jgi:hypothetical protein